MTKSQSLFAVGIYGAIYWIVNPSFITTTLPFRK